MKTNFVLAFVAIAVLAPIFAKPVEALSCLPIDMYLNEVVGKENVVIFSGASLERTEGSGYTAERIQVDEVKQGYAEEQVFVYHQKDETWGYLCNSGPKEKGSKGVYITERDTYGKYNVTQRLETSDKLVSELYNKLEDEDVTGERVELSATDRANQIIGTISDLIRQISILLKEYAYWKEQ